MLIFLHGAVFFSEFEKFSTDEDLKGIISKLLLENKGNLSARLSKVLFSAK